MARRFVDLSVPIQNMPMESNAVMIHYITHAELARSRAKGFHFPDLSYFPEGIHCATEAITQISTHSGTHLDAPWHYGPHVDGRPAKTIDQIPLEWCYGDAVVLDFHDAPRGHNIALEEVRSEVARLKHNGYRLKPMDIVLFRTDHTTKYLYTTDFQETHPGVSVEATEWLIDEGIKVMGIDAWGFDMPMNKMAELRKQGNTKDFFGSHYLGRRKEYIHAEKLCHLDELPSFDFTVSMFPVKIERASGAWVRAVAIIED